MTPRTTRAERLAMPLARAVVRELAVTNGGCVRPVQLRRTDIQTGEVAQVLVPCGHTLATVCPSCAERAKTLRAAQCREGWHLDREPIVQADEPDDVQRMWVEKRAETQAGRDQAEAAGQDTGELDELHDELDEEITRSGVRGKVMPATTARRHRSTRRRHDTPDLPKRAMAATTVGKTYTAPDGTTFRPSMFLTLTCPSYGGVREDGTPTDPAVYDYQRARADYSEDRRYRALVLLATFASLRWGEVTALRRRDLDLTAGCVRVRAAFSERRAPGSAITIGPSKSKAARRVVGVPRAVLPDLREHLAAFVAPEPGAFVFAAPSGTPLRRGNFNRAAGWSHAVAAIGVPGLHFHDLRHTGNTFAAASGAGLRDLMARMGHDSERAAMVYQHEARGADAAITNAIDAHIDAEQSADEDGDDGLAGALVPAS